MIRLLKIFALIATLSLAASADTLSGTVRNATTGKPAAGDDVVLLKLSQGMDEVARTKTDSAGRFTFDVADAASQHMVRVNHQNVNYHRPAPPGATSVEVEVFDVAAKVDAVKMVVNILRMETVEGALEVVEVYGLRNDSQPPRTWMSDSTLDVSLPAAANIREAMVAGPGGMPVNASPVPQKQPGQYSFRFPIRPGETRFQITYRLPYSGEASFQPRLKSAVEHLVIMLPRTMQFTSGAPFQEMTEEDGSTVHVSTTVEPGKEPSFQVSGTGVFEAAAAATGAPAENRPGGGLGPPSQSPDPLAQYRWYILGGLGLALVVGAFYLMQKPGGTRPSSAVLDTSALLPPSAAAAIPAPTDKRQLLLDALKDELFALETERLEGRISQEEYQQAKAGLDRALGRALGKKQ